MPVHTHPRAVRHIPHDARELGVVSRVADSGLESVEEGCAFHVEADGVVGVGVVGGCEKGELGVED